MIDIGKLERSHKWLEQEISIGVDVELKAAGRVGVKEARTSSKFKGAPSAGGLRNKSVFALKSRGRLRRIALSNAHPAAFAQDKGSGLYGPRRSKYPITAKPGKMLRFVSGGAVFFRKRVRHPGVKPTHFLRDATRTAFRAAGDGIDGKMAAIASKFRRL